MTFTFNVPTPFGAQPINLEPGESALLVGANGAGKTRLAAAMEHSLGKSAHRISAHRSLVLNPEVPKISEEAAMRGLLFGSHQQSSVIYRQGSRWAGNEATHLLNDFDYLLQALFAEQANTALKTHKAVHAGNVVEVKQTKLESLQSVWQRLLPHRTLNITGDHIEARHPGVGVYSASHMSDGERSIFYMIGQALAAPPASVLIVDEPELHIHPSILEKMWDEILSLRPDCAFVFITHDLHFAASRLGQKYVVKSYAEGPSWIVEPVPEDEGFDEQTTTQILGSRRPVLFVEGKKTSLDTAMYRACFPDWTVIPRNSCEEVIHAVVSMRQNASLTRITCAGIVDGDDLTEDEVAAITKLGVGALPVSEIENVVLLPNVAKAIAAHEDIVDGEFEQMMEKLTTAVVDEAKKQIDAAVMQCCRRQIDRTLKRVDLSGAATVERLADEYLTRTSGLDVHALAATAKRRIQAAIESQDLPSLLRHVDGKGAFIAAAATHLKAMQLARFREWLVRAMRSGKVPNLINEIRSVLPTVEPK